MFFSDFKIMYRKFERSFTIFLLEIAGQNKKDFPVFEVEALYQNKSK